MLQAVVLNLCQIRWTNQINEQIRCQFSDELHKPNVRKFTRRKVYSSFKDIIWGVDLADMQLISK